MKIVSLIYCLFCIASSFGQDAKDIYAKELTEKLTKQYYTDRPLSYDMEMKQYDSSEKILYNSMKGGIISSNYCYKLYYGEVDLVIEDTFMLSVNSKLKQMGIKKIRPTQRDSMLRLGVSAILEKLKSSGISVIKLNREKDREGYQLSFPNINEGVYTFYLDKKGYIGEINMLYYDTDANFQLKLFKMMIKYSNYKMLEKFSPIREYLEIVKSGYRLKEKYQEYKINNL